MRISRRLDASDPVQRSWLVSFEVDGAPMTRQTPGECRTGKQACQEERANPAVVLQQSSMRDSFNPPLSALPRFLDKRYVYCETADRRENVRHWA
jgi:hypothetical protein